MTCNREAPSVEEAAKEYAGRVAFVGVAWHGDDESFQGFIAEHGLSFPQISDDAAAVFDRFEVRYQPAAAFVTADGAVEVVHGAVEEDDLRDRLDALLAA